MTTKDWLNRANGLQREIDEMKETYQRALELACKTVSVPNDVSVQESHQNGTERRLVDVAVFSEMISEKISERYKILAEITVAIDRVKDTRLRTLLYARYINRKTWEEVAERLDMSDFWVRTSLHSQALQMIEKSRG